MADRESMPLLAYLAPWIDETVATKALAYILNRSLASRQGLDSLIKDGGVEAAPIEEVRTEVSLQGTGRVDIACNSKTSNPPILIEVKFSADLTSNQPGGYIDWLLKNNEESVLLFLVPESRISSLWPELKAGAERGGRKLVEVEAERRCMRVDGTKCHLMVVSWRTMLDTMAIRTKAAGEPPGVEADIMQLSGLAQRRNDEVVSPFTVDYLEIGPSGGDRRELDLQRIVDTAINQAVSGGWASRYRLSTSRRSSVSPYGRYFRLLDVGLNRELWLGVHNTRWESSDTPLWLWLYHRGDLERLRNMGDRLPGGLDNGYIPIHLKPSVGFNQVVDDVTSQLKNIAEAINNAR